MQNAREHFEKGMQALTDTSSFFGLFGSPPDYIIASHEFEQAGNYMKANKDYFGASTAYDKAAEAHSKMESYFLAAKLWDSCGNMLSKTEMTAKALENYEKASQAYMMGGSPENATKSLNNAAKLCQPKEALKYYLEITQILEDDEVIAEFELLQKGLSISLALLEFSIINSSDESAIRISKLLERYYSKLTNKTMWSRQVLVTVLIYLVNDYNSAEAHWLQNANVHKLEETELGNTIRRFLVLNEQGDEQGFKELGAECTQYSSNVANLVSRIKIVGHNEGKHGDIQDAVEEHGYL